MSILLASALQSTAAPDFFDMAIQTRDMEILLLEREVHTLRLLIAEQQKIIDDNHLMLGVEGLRRLSELSVLETANVETVDVETMDVETMEATAEVLPTVLSPYAPELALGDVDSGSEDKKKRHRSLKQYLVNGDRIIHTLKDSEWCVYYDGPTGELVGTGGVYRSLKDFVMTHRAELNRTIKTMQPWNECKVLRNGSYIKMSDLETIE